MLAGLSDIFRKHLEVPLELPVTLEETLIGLWQSGQAAWPGVAVEAADFVAYVAERMGPEPLDGALAGLHATELYLCCACLRGNPPALLAFDARYLSQVGVFVARMRVPGAFVDELTQVLRERLFVGDKPRLREYSGRGGLHNWLRVVTVRTALNLRRRRTELLATAPPESERAETAAQPDPELAYIKERYAGALDEALNRAFAQLSSEQRHLLRLHFLDGITLDQLAASLGVHRATVARRIAEARRAVLTYAQEWIGDRFALESAELGSLIGVLRSGLELSISRLLKSGAR
jgi:RNA polymerase sigma-70 factor (ECF subfamily)